MPLIFLLLFEVQWTSSVKRGDLFIGGYSLVYNKIIIHILLKSLNFVTIQTC